MPPPSSSSSSSWLPLSRRAASARSSAIRDLLEHASRPGMISLAGGVPDPRLFPLEQLQAAADHTLTDPANLQYGLTAGEIDVRATLSATVYGDPRPERCVVTTGSQQGLDLLARVVLDEGDTVVVGEPDYLGLLQAVGAHGARVAAVPIDGDGLDTDALADALAAGLRPKLCYVVPHFHNPTGAVFSNDRRALLLELAERYGFLVVEDDPYRDLWYDEPPAAATASAHVVVLRSASKVLAPGLRVGWMVGPRDICDAVTIAKQSADLHTSTLSQAMVARCLTADWFPGHLAMLRQAYAAKRDALLDAARSVPGLRIGHPRGGMFGWADLPGIDTAELLPHALEQGVAFVPGAAFSSTGGLSSRLRLSFATADPDQLREGAGRLTAAISRLRPDPAASPGAGRREHAPNTRSATAHP